MDALVATSQRPDALRRLFVGPSLAREVERNEHLRDLPTRRAVDTYAGPLYDGLDAGSWTAHAEERAAQRLVIVSALWGALRPADHIPPYRLHVCARLVGLDRLEPAWRTLLPPSSPMRRRNVDRSSICVHRPIRPSVARPASLTKP